MDWGYRDFVVRLNFFETARVTPQDPNLVISPADGLISAIEQVAVPPELALDSDKLTRISVFMNVFDVHVNRSPVDGEVLQVSYIPGKFINAELDKASEHNERQAFTLELADSRRIGVVQIAVSSVPYCCFYRARRPPPGWTTLRSYSLWLAS